MPPVARILMALVAGILILSSPLAAATPYYDRYVSIDANPIGLFSGKVSTITYEILFDMGQKNQTLSVRSVERHYDFDDGWAQVSSGGSIKNGQFLRMTDTVNVTEDISIGAHSLTLRFQTKLANETAWSEMEKSMTIYVQKQSGNEFSATEIVIGIAIAGVLAAVFFVLIRRERSSK